MDIPKPSDSVLIQLASLVVHLDESFSAGGHEFDAMAIGGTISSPEIKAWVAEFPDVLVPRKRSRDGQPG